MVAANTSRDPPPQCEAFVIANRQPRECAFAMFWSVFGRQALTLVRVVKGMRPVLLGVAPRQDETRSVATANDASAVSAGPTVLT